MKSSERASYNAKSSPARAERPAAGPIRSYLSCALGLVAVAFGVFGCGGGSDSTAPLELRFGHVGAPGSLFARSADEFAARVNARLGDRASVVVYGSSQLGGDEVLLQKLQLGTVDLALPSSIMSSRIDEFGVFEMPYLIQDREHMVQVEEEVFWPRLAPLARDKGYEVLAVWENGFRHVTNNTRPVFKPEDLRGVKLRTPRGVWRVKLFQAYGANPTPMPLSEAFLALQTGVVDGQENPLAQTWASKLYEVQAFLSLTGHVYTPAYLTASTKRWARLPEDVRLVLAEEARALRSYVHETAARLDEQLLADIEASGVAVNRADRAAFLEASQSIYDEFGETVSGGRELVEAVLPLAYP